MGTNSVVTPEVIASPPVPPPSGSPDALMVAWNNTLLSVTAMVAIWNNELRNDYINKTFAAYAADVMAGRTFPDKTPPPRPPLAWVVGQFTDATTGPNTTLGVSVNWATPARGTEPVCDIPPVPTPPPATTGGALQLLGNMQNVGDDTHQVGVPFYKPDGSQWVKLQSQTAFGVSTYLFRIG